MKYKQIYVLINENDQQTEYPSVDAALEAQTESDRFVILYAPK